MFYATVNGSLMIIGISDHEFNENQEEYEGLGGWFPSNAKNVESAGEVRITDDFKIRLLKSEGKMVRMETNSGQMVGKLETIPRRDFSYLVHDHFVVKNSHGYFSFLLTDIMQIDVINIRGVTVRIVLNRD